MWNGKKSRLVEHEISRNVPPIVRFRGCNIEVQLTASLLLFFSVHQKVAGVARATGPGRRVPGAGSHRLHPRPDRTGRPHRSHLRVQPGKLP